jgi:flagellar hook-associated protein 1 FlgK
MVGGNALVRGDKANHVDVIGANVFQDLTAPDAADAGTVRLVWEGTTRETGATSGRLTGILSALARPNGDGTGGAIAELAARYDAIAQGLADEVNALHTKGVTLDGNGGSDFFTPGGATSIKVAITDVNNIAAARAAFDGNGNRIVDADGKPVPADGALDGSLADDISRITTLRTAWSQHVVNVGVQTRTAAQRATNAESTRAMADDLLTAQAGVNLDEETVNLLAYQRAYEAAARVITSVDEILDTLINRTGVVGR